MDMETERLLKGCDYQGSLSDWIRNRRFIRSVIHKDGTILDIGCANGFFLLSLMLWSEYKLSPFGIDIAEGKVSMAKRIFGKYPKRFEVFDGVSDIDSLPSESFPDSFDFVYWNVFDSFAFGDPGGYGCAFLRKLFRKVSPGGRFILAFYDAEEDATEAIRNLAAIGYRMNIVKGSGTESVIIVYIEKE